MTNQYQQPSINLEGSVPSTFTIQNLSDLDAVAPVEASGARVITTPAGKPGIELQIRGHIELPEGQYIVDDAAANLVSRDNVAFGGIPLTLIAQNPV